MFTRSPSLQPKYWLLVALICLTSIYTFYRPLIASIDSIYGFLAYKGTLLTHSFNVVSGVSTADINQSTKTFQSWWSPGQWVFPGLLNYCFGMRLGLASIIITILFAASGFLGYYRVMRFFNFPPVIIFLSLIVIFSSSTFYQSFLIYQGGEILGFGTFPWFLLYVLSIKKNTIGTLAGIILLFLLCFLAKTTLLLYCSFVLIYKLCEPHFDTYILTGKLRLYRNSFLLLLPLIACLVFVQLFFLSKGPKPTLIHYFNFTPESLLVPLSAPLSSILSVQQWIIRLSKIMFTDNEKAFFQIAMYIILLGILIFFGRSIQLQKKIDSRYKLLLQVLYTGLSCFFVFAYLFDAGIDFSSRHFKLLGYLFIPGFLSILYYRLQSKYVHAGVLLFCLLGLCDIVYQKQKWTANRYVSANYFYRNLDNFNATDELDETSYKKLIDIDRTIGSKGQENIIFFVQANQDVALDVQHQCIMLDTTRNISKISFHGKGPVVVICLSKKTLERYENIPNKMFPDYSHFELIADTGRYQFFVARDTVGSGKALGISGN